MSKLRLAPTLTLPLEAITETLAVLGIRGSGKTNTAVDYAEELLDAGQQVVVMDPTDSWWGLKSSKDGQKVGYPVIVLGGKHQDLPLAPGDGKLVADFVVEQGASVICSLRGFESKQQELTFATAFLRRLYHLKGQQDTPLIARYPASVSKSVLAETLDMEASGGSFGARLSEVRAPGLLDETAPRGEVRAGDVLFPEGLD